MARCRDCEGDVISEADVAREDLCPSCSLDRILNDMMSLNIEQLASVAREAMAYRGVAKFMASKGDLVQIMGEAAVRGD